MRYKLKPFLDRSTAFLEIYRVQAGKRDRFVFYWRVRKVEDGTLVVEQYKTEGTVLTVLCTSEPFGSEAAVLDYLNTRML